MQLYNLEQNFGGIKMEYSIKPNGICAKTIDFDIEDNKVKNVRFHGGCQGSHIGIQSLVEGMDTEEVVKRLRGIRCGQRNTSCPDQLACALENLKEEN